MDYAKHFRANPSEAVAAIEALKGLAVLGEWEYYHASGLCDKGFSRKSLIEPFVFVSVEQKRNGLWSIAGWPFDDPECVLEEFKTFKLAMSAADAALTALPNVVLTSNEVQQMPEVKP